jgi:hypothetical protein
MKKKIFISLAVLVVLLLAAGLYLNYRNRTLSPPGNATLTSGDLTVTVNYSRPSARGRLIFGAENEKALQPYGKYWRLGANESTEVTFNQDVTINDKKVKAGTYRMFAIPGPEAFEIGLNSELGKWGYSEPDYSKDVVRISVPVEKTDGLVEQYTISLKESDDGINIIFEWSSTRFVVPVRKS